MEKTKLDFGQIEQIAEKLIKSLNDKDGKRNLIVFERCFSPPVHYFFQRRESEGDKKNYVSRIKDAKFTSEEIMQGYGEARETTRKSPSVTNLYSSP